MRLIARLLSLLEDLERDQSGSKEFSFLSFSLFERSPLRGISFERFGDASRVYTRNYMPAPLEETRENGFFQGYFLPALEDDAGPIIDPSKGHPPDGSSTSRTRMRFTFTNRSVRSLRRFSHPITAVERIDSISPRPSEREKRKEREREKETRDLTVSSYRSVVNWFLHREKNLWLTADSTCSWIELNGIAFVNVSLSRGGRFSFENA